MKFLHVEIALNGRHKESGVYNPVWRCSNEEEAQKIFQREIK
jgi:hypothetical protein